MDRLHPFQLCCWLLVTTLGCTVMRGPNEAERLIQSRQLTMQGVTAAQEGRGNEAETLFSQAIETCPVDERPRLHHANLLWSQGDYERAIRQMEEAVRLSAGEANLRIKLGEMYLELDRLAQAQGQARRAISANNSAEAWILRGNVLRRQNDLERALAAYQRALSIEPQNAIAPLAIADIYRELNRPISTLAVLDRWLDANPDSRQVAQVMHKKGLALQSLQRHSDASVCLAHAARKLPNNAVLLYDLSRAQFMSGDLVGAQFTIRHALRIAPRMAQALQLEQQLRH